MAECEVAAEVAADVAATATVDWNKDTHALVRFLEDERTGLVPVGRIEKKDTLEYNGSCKVKWSNGKKYQAFLLVSGTKEECIAKQNEVDPEDSDPEENEDVTLPAKKAKKDENGTLPKRKRTNAKKTKKVKKDPSKKPNGKAVNSKGKKDDFVIEIGAAPSSSISQHQSTEECGNLCSTETDSDTTSEDSEDGASHDKFIRIEVDDNPANRNAKPKHRFHNRQKIAAQIQDLKSEIRKHNKEQKLLLDREFKQIREKIDQIFTSGLARTLTPLLQSSSVTSNNQLPTITSPPQPTVTTQLVPTAPTTVTLSTSPTTVMASPSMTTLMPTVVTSTLTSTPSATTPLSTSVDTLNSIPGEQEETLEINHIGSEVNVTSNELISPSDIVPIFTKAKNRHHFAALLVAELIDEETRVKSNVRGRGKEKLDPTIIEWVEAKCFQYHPSEGNKKEEWERCIQSIDGKNRGMKRRKSIKSTA